MNLGIVIVLITAAGFLSNAINGRYLNFGVIRLLYYIGAFVHETSHAALCIATGAKIEEFSIFSSQPRVVHRKSKLPIAGEVLIAFAPIAGGLLFLFIVNRYLLGNYFALPQFSGWQHWRDMAALPLRFFSQVNLFQWQSWAMLFLFLNVGAMLGPSPQDLKNIWPMLIVFFFVKSSFFAGLGFLAIGLIFVNIAIQIVLIAVLKIAGILIRG